MYVAGYRKQYCGKLILYLALCMLIVRVPRLTLYLLWQFAVISLAGSYSSNHQRQCLANSLNCLR